MQISLANLNYTLSGVQYQKKKKKKVYVFPKNQKAHIMLKE